MKKIFLLLSVLFLTSCEINTDLDVENYNDADYNAVLSNATDLEKILESAYTDILTVDQGSGALSYMLNADQITSTNKFRDFWGFAQQPRKQFDSSKSYDGWRTNVWSWNGIYSAIKGANHIIRWIEGDQKPFIIDGVDKSKEALASAYMIKGMAEGFLALIFDKGYLVSWNTPVNEASTQKAYTEILPQAISDLDKAIQVANSASTFNSTYMVDTALNKTKFVQLVNSYAARFLIGTPRTKAEAKNTDFTKVLSYASNGITSDFMIPTKVGVWYSYLIDWGTYFIASAGYLPVDQKVMHLMDSSQPKDYPEAPTVLPAMTTSDSRASYFNYRGSNFGWLRADRDRSLFSSYFSYRWYNNNDLNVAGYMNPVFMKAEIDYIKAEATLKSSGVAGAVTHLNNSPRGTSGVSTGSTYADVMKALHYEYAVELHFSGGAFSQWTFMRRNDLLQKGSFTMMPIPSSELEAQGISELYTFGGVNNVGQEGTASTDGWKNEASYNE